jgi:hypothetical protein
LKKVRKNRIVVKEKKLKEVEVLQRQDLVINHMFQINLVVQKVKLNFIPCSQKKLMQVIIIQQKIQFVKITEISNQEALLIKILSIKVL